MRTKGLVIGIVAAGIVALTTGASEAWGHGRIFIGVGPYWGWGYAGPFGYPYPYPYRYPYGGYPPVTVIEQPRTYIEQPVSPDAAPPPAPEASAPASPERAYWYYCQSARDYYPSVPTCSEPWIRVAPRSP